MSTGRIEWAEPHALGFDGLDGDRILWDVSYCEYQLHDSIWAEILTGTGKEMRIRRISVEDECSLPARCIADLLALFQDHYESRPR